MSAADHLREAIDFGCTRDDHDHIAMHRAEVLTEAADDLVAACPDHGDADEAWMDCPCEYADELRRMAALAGSAAQLARFEDARQTLQQTRQGGA